MARYIIERSVESMTPEERHAVGKRSAEVADEMEGVVWVRSYISEAEGKLYCEYEAPSPEAVREHAQRAGIPVDHISEIAMEVSPAMFR